MSRQCNLSILWGDLSPFITGDPQSDVSQIGNVSCGFFHRDRGLQKQPQAWGFYLLEGELMSSTCSTYGSRQVYCPEMFNLTPITKANLRFYDNSATNQYCGGDSSPFTGTGDPSRTLGRLNDVRL